MADGYVMTIPKSVLDKLELADTRIKNIADSSEKTQKRVVTAFQNMANGIDPFLQKLQAIANLKNINFNKTFENASTAAEKAAGNIAKVATEINKMNSASSTPSSSSANTSVLAWQGINENLKIQQARLDAVNRSIKEYENTLARINSGKGGSVSTADQTAYQSNLQEAQAIQKTIAAYELKQQKIIALQQAQREQLQLEEKLRNLAQGKTSFAEEKQAAELAKLNEAFRTGQSEIQKRAKLTDEYRKSVEAANKAEEKRIAQANRKASSERAKSEQQAARAVEQYNKALNKSEGSIIQRTRKIEALANAQRALTATGRNYSQQISTIASETRRLQVANANAAKSSQNLAKEQSKILNTTEQLKRQFALLFSVSAIKGYIAQLITVRGEFELQQRALQSILQNKDQANEIWDKTVQLAVRSPFTVKELVTYTKQLAAYRIEADKLYDTNKMLADVSAGLGVSMDRLILAFGQVKAANYLRASEVRQFTEAGVNILGELATIYTELEGKMVSVGDVQERITKRMVKFGDVEEVFKRITSAGGIFYNMQEVQAETLAGMISNLRDTFDLMFNDIGKANDGLLKTFVTLLKDIVNNWERIGQIVIPIIGTLVGRFALLKVAQLSLAGGAIKRMFKILFGGFQMMNAQLTNNIRLTTVLQQRMKMLGTTSLGGWTAALSAVVIIVWEIYNALSAASKKQEELNKIATEGSFDASKSVAEYKRLADIVSDATKSYEEQKEALDTLKRTYGDILPAHMLEAKTIRDLQGNYEGATQAIYNYVAAKTKEKQIRYIDENYGDSIAESTNDVAKYLKKQIEWTTGAKISMAEALRIAIIYKQQIEQGEITTDNYATSLRNLVVEMTGLKNFRIGGRLDIFKGLVIDITEYKDLLKAIEEGHIGFGTFVERQMAEATKEIDNMTKDAKKSLDLLSKSKGNPLISKEQVDEAKKRVIEYFKWLGVQVDEKDFNSKFNNIIGGDIISLQDLVKRLDTASLDKQVFKLTSEFGSKAIPYIERLEKTLAGKEGTSFQKKIHDMVVTYAKENKMSLNGLDKALAETEENSLKYLPRITQAYKDIVEEITRIEFAPSPDFGTVSPEKLQEMKNLAKVYKMIIDSYPKTEKKKGESEAEKRLERQLDLLKQVKKAYEENRKYYNKKEATAKVKTDYADVFDEAKFPKGFIMDMSFDPSGIISAMDTLNKDVSESLRVKIGKAISDVRGEVDLDIRMKGLENTKNMLEEAFSGYELSVELDDSGVFNKDALSKMFGVKYKSLEDLKELLKNTYPDTSNLSEEETKSYNYYLQKINDLEDKSYKERLKKAQQFFKNTLDEVKKAQMESSKEIFTMTDLYNNDVISTDQYVAGIEESMKKVNDAMSKVSLEKLKESPEFIQALGSMAGYSSRELTKLAEKLRTLADESSASMTVEDMKSLYDIIDKVEQKAEKSKSPFQKSVWSDLKNIIDLKKQEREELANYNTLLAKRVELEIKLKQIIGGMESIKNSPNAGINASDKDEMAALQEEYAQIRDDLSSTNSQLGQSGQKLEGIKGKLDGATGGMGAAMGMVDKIVTGIYQSINATIELMNQFKDLAESNGVDTSKGGWREAQQAGEVLGNVNEKVMSSWNNFKSGNFAGAIADAVGSITTIFTTLNKQHDARREQDIQDEIKLVNRLSMAYQHLARKIENAYTIDTFNMSYENAERNLKEQIASTERMIAAEKDKKDQDDERIAEWQDQILQYQEQLEDLKAQKLQELGGFGSGSAMADAAQEFASAWMEAYMETGDGLDALNDKWDEFIQNIVVKQLALRGVTKFLEPIMKQIDDAIGNDSYLSTDELAKIKASVEEMNPKLNAYFKDIMEGFGDMLPQPGSASELTGLQKGIQGVTEETAGVIEAYLNSMRFFVADTNMQVQKLALFFSADPAQNPMYSELMSQTRLLRSIDDRLASVITSAGNHELGGFAIKAFI